MRQIFGWNNIEDLAKEMKGSGFSGLLDGYLVFAYKNLGKSGTIRVLVISKRLDGPGYIIGERPFSNGWTGFLPNMPPEYLREVIYFNLIENKTDKEIVEAFIANIEFYESRK